MRIEIQIYNDVGMADRNFLIGVAADAIKKASNNYRFQKEVSAAGILELEGHTRGHWGMWADKDVQEIKNENA